MLNQNNNIFLQDNHFRFLFDRVVYSQFAQKISHLNLNINNSSHISILESSEMKSSEDCKSNRGKWRFITNHWDYTCGVYDAIEIVRQSILFAKKLNKNNVEIALVYSKNNPNYFYLLNCDQQIENYIDVEKLKKHKVFSYYLSNQTKCDCDAGVSQKILSQVLEPVLNNLMKLMGYKVHLVILKNKIVSERSGPFSSMYFQRDLKAIRIEWGLDPVFSPLPEQPTVLNNTNKVLLLAA